MAIPAVAYATIPDNTQQGEAAHPDASGNAPHLDIEYKLRSLNTIGARELALRTSHGRRRRAQRRAHVGGGTSSQTAQGPAELQAIAQCESGGDPAATNGQFRGLYQFDEQTWQSVGGTGDPAAASPAEQTRRAEILLAREGTTPWPVCGAGR